MLQQTRVETVIPYYERWLSRFPHLDTLADAHPDDVLKQWEGLGYYSRARNLQRAAQMVRERHAGELPADYAQLRELPGVGPYTAAALASIVFTAPHAAVDGNVRRVLSRVLDLPCPTPAELQEHADHLLDRDRPGDYNQAIMDLGATICTPRHPDCAACPVQRLCRAHRNNTVPLRPQPAPKAPGPASVIATLVAVHRGRILVVQRPARGLLAGLWEFPAIAATAGHQRIGSITHTFTHRRITYEVYFTARRVRHADARWVELHVLDELAFSRAQRRILRLATPWFA